MHRGPEFIRFPDPLDDLGAFTSDMTLEQPLDFPQRESLKFRVGPDTRLQLIVGPLDAVAFVRDDRVMNQVALVVRFAQKPSFRRIIPKLTYVNSTACQCTYL